jgi:hypothetical protein
MRANGPQAYKNKAKGSALQPLKNKFNDQFYQISFKNK